MYFFSTLSAVDVDMHCQKVANGFLAVDVLFGGAYCFSAVDLELFGGGCCFSAVDVLFGGGLKNPLPLRGVEGTLGSHAAAVAAAKNPFHHLLFGSFNSESGRYIF